MVKPRVVAFVNGELGRHALSVIGDDLVAVVINDKCDYQHGPLMEKPWLVQWYYAHELNAESILALCPTHGVSAGFRSIIPKEIIDLFPHGIANVHTSFLPLNRGAHPNAWTIFLDQQPGVTLHLIDEGVDTGPILDQMRVQQKTTDTADKLQLRLIEEACRLMRFSIPAWLRGDLTPTPQRPCHWPTHKVADLESICIDGGKKYQGFEVINILRARTFPPHPGALYNAPDGKRYRVRIQIEEDKTPCP